MRFYGGYSLRRSLKDYGWVVAIAAVVLAVIFIYSKAPAEVGVPLPGNKTIALSPGDEEITANQLCQSASRVYVRFAGPEQTGVTRVAETQDGKQSVEWVDRPLSFTATYYWQDEAGVQQSRLLEVDSDAAKCLRRSRGS
jgi:hypothetical protein